MARRAGTWIGSPSFAGARYAQGASLLADGRVLITGGYVSDYHVPPVVLD